MRKKKHRKAYPKRKTFLKTFLTTYWCPLLWTLFFILLWPTLFFEKDGGIFAKTRSVWGDWAQHMTYSNHFAKNPPSFWITSHPLFLGAAFQYHYLVAFFSGILIRLGFGQVWPQTIPAILCTGIGSWLLFCFYRQRVGSGAKASLGVFLFFLGGGLGFVYVLSGVEVTEYSMIPDRIVLGSLFSHLLIPQKALQLGMVAGLTIFLAMEVGTSRQRLGAAVLMGVLPLAHAPTFVVVSVTCGFCLALRYRRWREYLPAVLLAVAVTLAVYLMFLRNTSATSYLGWMPGWLAYSGERPLGFFLFWFLNWSFILPLVALGLWRCPQSRNPFTYAGLLLFVVINFIRLQPWDWDNTKILFWVYLLLVPVMLEAVEWLWKGGITARFATAVMLTVTTATGAMEVWRHLPWSSQPVYQLFGPKERELARELEKILLPTDRTLVADYHHDWVSALAGAQIVMGFTGWMWATYGDDLVPRQADVRRMFAGDGALLEKYGVTLVVINDNARQGYPVNQAYFEKYPKVLVSPLATIYKLRR